jgi:hypothetical protein
MRPVLLCTVLVAALACGTAPYQEPDGATRADAAGSRAADDATVPFPLDAGRAAPPVEAGADASPPATSAPKLRPRRFSALASPVLEGQFAEPAFPGLPAFPFAGDASVLKVAGTYWMYHTCYATDRSGTDTCLARSPDGVRWTLVDTGDKDSLGRVLRSPTDAWDAAHETPYALLRGNETWLFAASYAPPSAGFLGASSVRLALARAPDGVRFGPTQGPLFEPTPGGLDDHGLTSPTVLDEDGLLTVIYTGFCIDVARCPRAAQGRYTAQLAATSTDGVRWSKLATPVLLDADVPWAPDGIAETHVVRDPDSGKYLMFFQALNGNQAHVVGLAWSDLPVGPYHVHPEPLLVPTDVGSWANGGIVAPHALFDEQEVLLWFSGEERDQATGETKTFRVGLARAARPLLVAAR